MRGRRVRGAPGKDWHAEVSYDIGDEHAGRRACLGGWCGRRVGRGRHGVSPRERALLAGQFSRVNSGAAREVVLYSDAAVVGIADDVDRLPQGDDFTAEAK